LFLFFFSTFLFAFFFFFCSADFSLRHAPDIKKAADLLMVVICLMRGVRQRARGQCFAARVVKKNCQCNANELQPSIKNRSRCGAPTIAANTNL
jgi:hypothetical protein